MSTVLRLRNRGLNEMIEMLTGCFWIGLWDFFSLLLKKESSIFSKYLIWNAYLISFKQMDKRIQKLKDWEANNTTTTPGLWAFPIADIRGDMLQSFSKVSQGWQQKGPGLFDLRGPWRPYLANIQDFQWIILPVALLCSLRLSGVLVLERVTRKNKLFVFL